MGMTRRGLAGAAALLPAALMGSAHAQPGPAVESTFDRVNRTKVLRIAALPGEPIADRPLDAIAGDLVALLPRTNTFASPSPPERPAALLSENARAGLALGAGLYWATKRD